LRSRCVFWTTRLKGNLWIKREHPAL
jgi:hypothetical protein